MKAIVYGFGIVATIGAGGLLITYLEHIRLKLKDRAERMKKLENEQLAIQKLSEINTEFMIKIKALDKKNLNN